MLSSLVVVVTIVSAGPGADGPDRSALIQLLDGAQQAIGRDVTFDYEGKRYFPGIEGKGQKLGPDGVKLVYTGKFTRRSDGAALLDIYTFDKKTNRARHAQVAILNGTTESSGRQADEKQAKISIKQQGPLEFAGPGNYRNIWLADWVRKFAESPYLYDSLGYKDLDGAECLVVRFRLAYDEKPVQGVQVSHTFWIDLNRGGQVVRAEKRWGNDLVGLTTVVLGKFQPGPGRTAWLPVSGREESRLAVRDGQRKFLDEPVYYDTYFMIPITHRFNQDLKDSAFSVKANPGDQLRKARYEFGQYMVRPKGSTKRPTDAEVKANLDRMLKDSAVMAHELKASSSLRDGPGWTSYWPWAVAGLATAGAGFLYYKSRNPSQP